MTVAVQHFSKRDGLRLHLYDEDGCLLPASTRRLDKAPRRKTLIVARSKTIARLPGRSPKVRPKSFWRDLQRALGGDEALLGYVSRATARTR